MQLSGVSMRHTVCLDTPAHSSERFEAPVRFLVDSVRLRSKACLEK